MGFPICRSKCELSHHLRPRLWSGFKRHDDPLSTFVTSNLSLTSSSLTLKWRHLLLHKAAFVATSWLVKFVHFVHGCDYFLEAPFAQNSLMHRVWVTTNYPLHWQTKRTIYSQNPECLGPKSRAGSRHNRVWLRLSPRYYSIGMHKMCLSIFSLFFQICKFTCNCISVVIYHCHCFPRPGAICPPPTPKYQFSRLCVLNSNNVVLVPNL